MASNLKPSGLTNRADAEAKGIAPINRDWRIGMVAELD
jgi:hypothetical protein